MWNSEERFHDILAISGHWTWEVDSKGRYTYVSPAVENVLGYKPAEVLCKYFYDFFHPEDKDGMKETVFEVFSGKKPFRNFLNKVLHKNGSEVFLESSGVPVTGKDEELSGYRGVDRDVTCRIKAEQDLRLQQL